jgi:hypothetical protein
MVAGRDYIKIFEGATVSGPLGDEKTEGDSMKVWAKIYEVSDARKVFLNLTKDVRYLRVVYKSERAFTPESVEIAGVKYAVSSRLAQLAFSFNRERELMVYPE